ncbi:General stress protein 69 [Phycisphaerae bacterium RAS1]|nr:General stress protein 69 [Phycisphaerae bacterium RAS1]
MVRRPLGQSGLNVTPVGFGAFKIGRNEGIKYPHGYELPDDRTVEKLLNGVLDLGINYIDTAPAYGLSEERIGRCIAHRRGELVLSTKVGETFENGRSTYDFSKAAIESSVARSLKRLRCDYVDIVFIHASADDLAILRETPVIEALLALRRRGLARAVGLSGKTVAAAEAAIAWADVLMIEYHALDRSHAGVMSRAGAAGVGVVVKKGLASGRLPAREAIPFALAAPGVGSLVVGGLSLDHLRENVRLAEEVLK